MKRKKRLGAIKCLTFILAVLSAAAAVLFGCSVFFNRAFGGKTVNINDENRETVAPLIAEIMTEQDGYKGIDGAVSVSEKGGFIKGANTVTVLYRDGSSCAHTGPAVAYPDIVKYINDNGFKTYSYSNDVIKLCGALLILVACIVTMTVIKRKQKKSMTKSATPSIMYR